MTRSSPASSTPPSNPPASSPNPKCKLSVPRPRTIDRPTGAALRDETSGPLAYSLLHATTVRPPSHDVTVSHAGYRPPPPGVSDKGTGLAALVAIARACHEAHIKPRRTILFVADVGEEGECNLRGMRALVETYRPKLKSVIVLDGSGTDHVTTKALASRRLEATINGPGGHSWSDFGMPHPINALVRASPRFINTQGPVSPRTPFHIAQIEGGTSLNSIPYEAKLKVDIRSESEDELTKPDSAPPECITP